MSKLKNTITVNEGGNTQMKILLTSCADQCDILTGRSEVSSLTCLLSTGELFELSAPYPSHSCTLELFDKYIFIHNLSYESLNGNLRLVLLT
jgi:hypothetical protein